MASIFSKIAQGEIPSYKVAESDRYCAFLDINPLVKGHVLVIPREETDYFFDLSDDDLGGIMVFAKKIAKAIQKTIPCKRVGVAVIGLDVPHAHVHLIPLQGVQDIDFSRPKLKLAPEEFRLIADEIAANIVSVN
jgi:histidine triad (HIT) family protein